MTRSALLTGVHRTLWRPSTCFNCRLPVRGRDRFVLEVFFSPELCSPTCEMEFDEAMLAIR